MSSNDEEVFLGHSITRHKEISEATSSTVDAEVRGLIERNYSRAEKILRDNIHRLHAMADALMKYETINIEQIRDIMDGKPVREPANWQSTKEAKKKSQDEISKQESLKLDEEEGTASAHGTSTQ